MRCRSMSSGESLNGLNMGPRRSSSLKGRGARQRRRFPGACRTHGAHGAVPERALSWPGRQLVGHGSVDGLYGHVVRSGAHTSARVTCQCSRVGIVRSYESKYVKIPVKKRFVALQHPPARPPALVGLSPQRFLHGGAEYGKTGRDVFQYIGKPEKKREARPSGSNSSFVRRWSGLRPRP